MPISFHHHNNTHTTSPYPIYKGIRGELFTEFLYEILTLTNLKDEYLAVLLDKSALELYDKVFTHKTADQNNNYEFLEFVGDTTLNKAIAWYLARRFPQLNCASGVKVLTRMKINLISKRSFASFAKKLCFWSFISADSETRETRMEKTLEDVFEAFFGATELLIDDRIRLGAGYHVCYNIISSLLDDTEISLDYELLFDAKTRLKEIFDFFQADIGTLKYQTQKVDRLHHVSVYRIFGKQKICIGTGKAPLKSDAQQVAAEAGIRTLRKQKFVKPISNDYFKFGCNYSDLVSRTRAEIDI